MLWLVSCKRNYLKNCTTTTIPTNYLQLLPCHPQIYKWSKEIKVINKISHHRIAERPSIKKRLLSFFRFRLLLLSVREKSTVGNAVICPGEISLGIAFAQLGTQSTFASLQKKKLEEKIICKREVFFVCHHACYKILLNDEILPFFLNMLRINTVQTLNFHKSLVNFFALHRICYNAMRNI